MNALPMFVTNIDGLDIHFIHVKSKHPNALPIIVTHGWPGSIVEQLKIIDPLSESDGARRQSGRRLRRRDPVASGLRLLRQADRARLGTGTHCKSLDDLDGSARLQAVRRVRRRLGDPVTEQLAVNHPDRVRD